LLIFHHLDPTKHLKARVSVTKDLTNELKKLVTSCLLKHRGIKSKAAAKYSKEGALKIWFQSNL